MAKATATVSISEETNAMKIVVPPGTKWTDVGKIVELCTTTILRAPRLCNMCISGHVLQIVEELPTVTKVDID
jgi:hypothetical protein